MHTIGVTEGYQGRETLVVLFDVEEDVMDLRSFYRHRKYIEKCLAENMPEADCADALLSLEKMSMFIHNIIPNEIISKAGELYRAERP